ncbi:MAG: 3-hydroxyisobutyrate dehydrogenase, partial [Brevundimonas sp.]
MKIAFVGLGNMGGGMAANLAKAGHDVAAFDLAEAAVSKAVEAGCRRAGSVTKSVADAEVVITMLPAGKHVRGVYGDQVFGHAPTSALLIDCSTVDLASVKAVAAQAAEQGYRFVDAPVSGGIAAANGGTLTFMVGGSAEDFA